MKQYLYKILGLIVLLGCVSCSNEQVDSILMEENDSLPTYRMRFDVGIQDYEANTSSTRLANGIWDNGDKVYLRFREANGVITGVGVYDSETDSWSIRPEKSLAMTDLSLCDVIYFLNPIGETAFRATLAEGTTIYADTSATYMLYDDLLVVTAVLSPKTGRIRFKGTVGQTFGVNGLSYYAEYVFNDNTYSSKPLNFSSAVLGDGFSPFVYAYFTDYNNKTLTFDYTDNAVFQRTFPETTLREGESGYVTIPTIGQHEGWTLTNKTNGKPIELPALSAVTVDPIRSYSATMTATVTSDGNGLLTDTGFILSTESGVTLSNGIGVSCGTSSLTFSKNQKELSPETKYYVKAYAINEKGVAMSDEVSFTTAKDPGGSGFETGGFDKEEDWDQ